MYVIQNGSKCPCCGEILEGKSEEWLNALTLLLNSLHLEEVELKPVDGFPPPDAGLNPPVKPISFM